jgi:hypothetical protein
MSSQPKLYSDQLEVLRDLARSPAGYRRDYLPAAKMVEMGFARWTDDVMLEITRRGLAALRANEGKA